MLPRQALQQLAKDYTSPATAFLDYGIGAGIGALGQQGMNWATDGADPNPLISGLLGAPINRAINQSTRSSSLGRAMLDLESANNPFEKAVTGAFPNINKGLGSAMGNDHWIKNSPIEMALGSAAMLGAVPVGAGTSIYNVATDGTDYDNNLTSGLGALAALAPITYAIMNRNKR